MAVEDYLKPQRSPLSVYDEQLAQMLRQQSAGIGAQDIAAEAYGGKFPVGTMTAKILGGFLARGKEKSALNREAQAQKARALYAQYLRTGKIDGKSVDETGNIYEMTEQPMFKEEQVLSMVPSGRNERGAPSLGRAPEVSVAQDTVRDMTTEMPTPATVGESADPSWFDKTFSGDLTQKEYKTLDDIKTAANIDHIAALQYEEKRKKGEEVKYSVLEKDGNIFYYDESDPSKGEWLMSDIKTKEGFRVLKAEEIDDKKLPALTADAFYQIDDDTGRIYRTNATSGKEIEITVNTGDTSKGGTQLGQDFWKAYGLQMTNYSEARKQIIQAKNLLGYVETDSGPMYTGAFAGTVEQALSMARGLRIFDERDDPDSLYGELYQRLLNKQTFSSATNEIVLAFIKNLGRNPTDLDLKFMIKTQPGADKTKEANAMILTQRMAIAEGNKEYAEWYATFSDEWQDSPEADALYENMAEGTNRSLGYTSQSILRFNTIAMKKLEEISEKTSANLKNIYNEFNRTHTRDGQYREKPSEKSNIISMEEVLSVDEDDENGFIE